MNMVSTEDHNELLLSILSYYVWFDIKFNVVCTILKGLLG